MASETAEIRVASGASVALTASGVVHCLASGNVFAVGASPDVTRAVLSAVDGTRSLDQIALYLEGAHGAGEVRAVLDALVRVGVLVLGTEPRPTIAASVVVLGNHVLLSAIDRALDEAGYANRTRVHVTGFAEPDPATTRSRVLTPAPALVAPDADRVIGGATASSLAKLLGEFDLAVCALEGIPYQAILEVNRAALDAGIPCVFVTPFSIGPVVSPGAAPCLGCLLLTTLGPIDNTAFLTLPTMPAEAFGQATEVARVAVSQLQAPNGSSSVAYPEAGGRWRTEPLLPHGDCPFCATTGEGPLAPVAESAIEIARTWPVSPQATLGRDPNAFRTVGIVGGGTAGYLAALALRRHRPELEVTLIESSAIPVIGVGEATTPELVKFLHSPRFLDRSIVDLYRRVRPTWKLGIKFMWGKEDFTFPFQRGRILESLLYDGHINRQSLGAMLMMANRAPVLRDENGKTVSLNHIVRWAYHLENRRFVRYLNEEAEAAGVRQVDARIAEVVRSPDGEEVAALVTDDGRRFSFDLYIDASGFRSILLEGALGSPFTDWSSTLFNDRAVVATVPHDGTVKPYTLAETMDAGWCWNIPFEDEDHRGYVFSSRFLTPDQAEAEMRAKNPEMGDAGLVRFRSGRHAHFWKGNVVAVGNSYGFVEPLESTALHMLVLTLELLTSHFPESRHDRAIVKVLDRRVSARWDALRWFLGIHYRYNRRLDTPYWRAANTETDVSGAFERVALFGERAPLSYRSSLFYTVLPSEFFSDDHSFDTLLMGQGVPARYAQPTLDRTTWARRMAALERARKIALPQQDAIRWLVEERPDELEKLKSSRQSWLHTWVPA